MTLSTRTRALTLSAALTGTLALAACGAANGAGGGSGDANDGQQLSGTLVGAGASSQQAAMQGWAAGYVGVRPDVTVNYDPVGSGGGRAQFLSGGTDFAGTDAYLDGDELMAAEARCGGDIFELPNYISPIAVVYNLEGVPGLQLSPATLAGIFDQKITTWTDPAIAADNPGARMPDVPVTAVNRSDESGTTGNFLQYLSAAAGEAWAHEADGRWPVPGGEGAQGTSGVISAVGAAAGAIGYADLSQAGDLGVAAIGVGDEFVRPTAEAAAAVVENSDRVEGRGEHDYAIELARDTAESGHYPIVLISYHVGCMQYENAQTAALVRDFMSYVVSDEGQRAAASAAGSAPISDSLRDQGLAAIGAAE